MRAAPVLLALLLAGCGGPAEESTPTTTTIGVTIDECVALKLTPTFKGGDETARALWVYDTLKKLGSVQIDPEKMEGPSGVCKRKYALRIEVDGERIFEIELTKGPWVNAPEVQITPPTTETTLPEPAAQLPNWHEGCTKIPMGWACLNGATG